MVAYLSGVYTPPFTGGIARTIGSKYVEEFNVNDFGATGDGKFFSLTGAITSGSANLVVSNASFVAGDVGKMIHVAGAGAAAALLKTTISAVTNSTTVVLANTAGTTVTAKDVSYGTDQAAAFVAMRNYMRQDKSKHYRILIPPGGYLYSNNRWLMGVGAVSVIGYGAYLQSSDNSALHQDNRPISTDDLWQNIGDASRASTSVVHEPGELINTVAAGATSVTLTGAIVGTATPVSGQRVLIYGYCQQFDGGFPLNPRYFEWNKITAYNSGTGVITLETPLTYGYKSTWRDHAQSGDLSYGKGRIIILDRPNFYYPRFIAFYGVTFKAHPSSLIVAGQSALQICADTVYLEDVDIGGNCYPSENRIFRATRTTVRGVLTETDKVVDAAIFDDSTCYGTVSGATGCNNLEFNNSILLKGTSCRPRNLSLRKCTLYPQNANGVMVPYSGFWPTRLNRVEDCIAVNNGTLTSVIDPGVIKTLTVSGVDGSNQILLTDNAANQDVIRDIDLGTRLWLVGYSDSGVVTNMDYDGTNFVLGGTWKTTIAAAQVWEYQINQAWDVRNLVVSGPKVGQPWRYMNVITNDQPEKKITFSYSDIHFTTFSGTTNIYTRGLLVGIRLWVHRVYTGADATPLLTVATFNAAVTTNIIIVNVKTATSYTESYLGTKYSSVVPSTHINIPIDGSNPGDFLQLKCRSGGSPFAGTAQQMPKITVELDVMPFSAH